jgi:hypothetical protein
MDAVKLIADILWQGREHGSLMVARSVRAACDRNGYQSEFRQALERFQESLDRESRYAGSGPRLTHPED